MTHFKFMYANLTFHLVISGNFDKSTFGAGKINTSDRFLNPTALFLSSYLELSAVDMCTGPAGTRAPISVEHHLKTQTEPVSLDLLPSKLPSRVILSQGLIGKRILQNRFWQNVGKFGHQYVNVLQSVQDIIEDKFGPRRTYLCWRQSVWFGKGNSYPWRISFYLQNVLYKVRIYRH